MEFVTGTKDRKIIQRLFYVGQDENRVGNLKVEITTTGRYAAELLELANMGIEKFFDEVRNKVEELEKGDSEESPTEMKI